MKRLMQWTLITLVAVNALAGSPRDSIVVSVDWLAKHINDPDLVLLHIGDKAEYDAKHIPGARRVSLQDVALYGAPDGKSLMLEMPPADDLKARLEKLGISDNSRVVVYYGKDWISPTTRVLYTLNYAGLGERAHLLDGGMQAWIKAGHPVTDVVPEAKPGKLASLKAQPLIVDAEFVKAHLGKPGYAVIDARAIALYDGSETGGSDEHPHKTGHITGASSVPYSTLVNDAYLVRPADELRAAFDKAGVKKDDTVIAYCHIGQQATATLLAARTLGHKVLLYDGSFEDWSRKDGAVTNPAKK